MAVSNKLRRILIAGSLVCTLAAVGWVNEQDQVATAQADPHASLAVSKPQPEPKMPDNRQPDSTGGLIQLEKLKRLPPEAEAEDIFKRKSWYVPPPPPKPMPPPPPMAPPLPFSYIGKLIDGEKVTVFLARQDRNYAVKQGEIIDGTYRVEEVKPPMMTLLYIPLNQKQSMQIGEAN